MQTIWSPGLFIMVLALYVMLDVALWFRVKGLYCGTDRTGVGIPEPRYRLTRRTAAVGLVLAALVSLNTAGGPRDILAVVSSLIWGLETYLGYGRYLAQMKEFNRMVEERTP